MTVNIPVRHDHRPRKSVDGDPLGASGSYHSTRPSLAQPLPKSCSGAANCPARNHLAGDRHHRHAPGRHGCHRWRREPDTGSPLLITGGSGSVWTVAGNYYAPISADAHDRIANNARSGRIYPELDRGSSNHQSGQGCRLPTTDERLQCGDHGRLQRRPRLLHALRQPKFIGRGWVVWHARDHFRNDDHRWRRDCAWPSAHDQTRVLASPSPSPILA